MMGIGSRLMPIAGALLFAVAQAAGAVEAGQKAPGFSLPSETGTTRLEDFTGKVVYVDFWASWCGPCRQSFPWLNEMQKQYGANGLVVVGVNVDKRREDAQTFLSTTPAQFRIAYDTAGATPKEWKVMGMPSSYLVGRDGKVQLVHPGFREADRSELEAQIRRALEQK